MKIGLLYVRLLKNKKKIKLYIILVKKIYKYDKKILTTPPEYVIKDSEIRQESRVY